MNSVSPVYLLQKIPDFVSFGARKCSKVSVFLKYGKQKKRLEVLEWIFAAAPEGKAGQLAEILAHPPCSIWPGSFFAVKGVMGQLPAWNQRAVRK